MSDTARQHDLCALAAYGWRQLAVDLLDSVRHRSTTATYDVATTETLGLNVIKEQKAWSPKLRRPQRDPSLAQVQAATRRQRYKSCCRLSSRSIAWVP